MHPVRARYGAVAAIRENVPAFRDHLAGFPQPHRTQFRFAEDVSPERAANRVERHSRKVRAMCDDFHAYPFSEVLREIEVGRIHPAGRDEIACDQEPR